MPLALSASSTRKPRSPSTLSIVLTTLSKELLAPFSCVKRARARFALRPRSSTVKVSMARETGRIWRAREHSVSDCRLRLPSRPSARKAMNWNEENKRKTHSFSPPPWPIPSRLPYQQQYPSYHIFSTPSIGPPSPSLPAPWKPGKEEP